MTNLLHQFIMHSAAAAPRASAISYRGIDMDYQSLAQNILRTACAFIELGLGKQERVAVFLPKQFETVICLFGVMQAGSITVPINPLLKNIQTEHILRDSGARILVTNLQRLKLLAPSLHNCHDLHTVVCVDMQASLTIDNLPSTIRLLNWLEFLQRSETGSKTHRLIDTDVAAILYTSGSTGRAKGVVLSHRNMVAGARSVCEYLANTNTDRLLAVLPFSFDYGFSQLTTAFYAGASVVLLDYMLPRDVVRVFESDSITGMAAVPAIWQQLAGIEWPAQAKSSLRYITNSGGVLPRTTIRTLREKLPQTDIFLMYGFTEAFRATYLPPSELERRPDSIGKAIPNAEILVVREDGSPCAPNEQGELVQLGSHVSGGYWNDPDKTARHFRPLPFKSVTTPLPDIAAWSGDTVRMDEEGYLYFIGRNDDMIKTSGYRVSPTEIEEIVYMTGLAREALAFGVPHRQLGQAIVLVVTPATAAGGLCERILLECRKNLPSFMLPLHVEVVPSISLNPNGKFDRRRLANEYKHLFVSETEAGRVPDSLPGAHSAPGNGTD